MPASELASPTLASALEKAAGHRWRDMRSGERNICQARHAIATLERIIGRKAPVSRNIEADGWTFAITTHQQPPGDTIEVSAVTQAHLRAAVREWLSGGLSPGTVHARLTSLSVLGVKVSGCYPKLPRKLKWWLRPEQQDLALAWLAAQEGAMYLQLADLLEFITLTGLRVEEALRLSWSDVVQRPTRTVLAVPGTKTQAAQRTLPISEAAAAVLERRRGVHPFKVFPAPYYQMGRAWRECREHIGLENPREATLKAFRRNAARSLTTNGMPTAILKEYLGHTKIDTTLGYLKLTGGYSEEEYGKWL